MDTIYKCANSATKDIYTYLLGSSVDFPEKLHIHIKQFFLFYKNVSTFACKVINTIIATATSSDTSHTLLSKLP